MHSDEIENACVIIIIIEKDEDGFYAHCPELVGCQSQGDTLEEVKENIIYAIKLYFYMDRFDLEKTNAINSIISSCENKIRGITDNDIVSTSDEELDKLPRLTSQEAEDLIFKEVENSFPNGSNPRIYKIGTRQIISSYFTKNKKGKLLHPKIIRTLFEVLEKKKNEENEYLEELVRDAEESDEFFSNEKKVAREIKTCIDFLKYLRMNFSEDELIPVNQEDESKIDISFRDARFQIREIMGKDRRRHQEYKDDLEKRKNAESIQELIEPSQISKPLGLNKIIELITEALGKKAKKYGADVCDKLDALVYVNLKRRYLEREADVSLNLNDLKKQGWRSVSFLMVPYSVVVYAESTAPDFLRKLEGQICKYDTEKDPSYSKNFR